MCVFRLLFFPIIVFSNYRFFQLQSTKHITNFIFFRQEYKVYWLCKKMANTNSTDVSKLVKNLTKVYGVGEKTAKSLIEKGVKSKSDLKKPEIYKTLPEGTKLHLRYKVLNEISWDIVHSLLAQFPPYIIGVGSYRRKKQILHDIDVLTFKPIETTIADIKSRSREKDPRTEEYPYKVLGDYSSGEQKHSFVVKYKVFIVRVDVFYAPCSEKPFALLHYTGSRNFNIRIRAVAKKKGYKLNQHGLYVVSKNAAKNTEKNTEKNDTTQLTNVLKSAKTEKDILDFLNITYKKPEERSE